MWLLITLGNLLPCGRKHIEKEYPRDYFASPVAHEIELTGTFGELRPNHFHAGIDIRPKNSGVTEPIFAAADGWVSRIHVQPAGYGNVLYIDHPNGYTTVYAHLDKFSPDLADYVKANQYAQEKFEVNLTIAPYQFKINRGQQIGLMGNTGSSQGTHLHFEVRETGTDEALNPLLFGFPVADNKAPKLYELKIYDLNGENETVASREIYLQEKAKKQKVKKGKKWKTITIAPDPDAPYTIQDDTIEVMSSKIAFGIKTYDSHDWSSNTNGVFGVKMTQDDYPIFAFDTERIPFAETRYINAHIDYVEKLSGGGYFNRCYRLPGNRLSIYKNMQNDGVVYLDKNQYSKINIVAFDAAQNADTLTFWVHRNDVDLGTPKRNSFYQHLSYNQENTITYGNLTAVMPEGCLYESVEINVEELSNPSVLGFSPMYRLHKTTTPIHKSFNLTIRPTIAIPDSLRDKVFIAYREGDGGISNCGKAWSNDALTAQVNAFGNYFIMADTSKPNIKPIRFQYDMKNENRMSFRVSDNINLDKNLYWSAVVDGRWILMQYDIKSKALTHIFDEHIGEGEHELKLAVQDKQGNEQVFIQKFVR